MNAAVLRRLEAAEQRHAVRVAGRGRRSKAERDAAVRAVLANPEALEAASVSLMGPGYVERHRAVLEAALRADT